jgi:hypothetical protein
LAEKPFSPFFRGKISVAKVSPDITFSIEFVSLSNSISIPYILLYMVNKFTIQLTIHTLFTVKYYILL